MSEKSTFRSSRFYWILGWTGICYGFYAGLFFLAGGRWIGDIFAGLFSVSLVALVFFPCLIAGAIVLAKSADPKSAIIKLTCSMLCGIYGLVIYAMYWMAIPGYITPFFNNPNCQMVALVLLLWQVVGVVVLFRVQKLWEWLAAVVCFSLPLTLMVRIGPILLFRSQYLSDSKFLEIMTRADIVQIQRLDGYIFGFFIFLACVTYPGIWMKVFRLKRRSLVTSQA